MIFEDFHNSLEGAESYSRCYDIKAEVAFNHCLKAKEDFKIARRIIDLGCGVGASSLFIARICPLAKITMVDPHQNPLEGVKRRLGKRFDKHLSLSATEFLEESGQSVYDVVFLVKSSHILISDNCRDIARCIKPGGYLMQIDGDVRLPSNIDDYFKRLWIDEWQPTEETLLVNSLWQKS